MKSKYVTQLKALTLIVVLMVSCSTPAEDWNNPKKIYNLLCACQNKNGKTIDEQLVTTLKERGIDVGSTDKINTYISNNTEAFMKIVDDNFMSDTVYLANLVTAKDTLISHGSNMDVQGQIGALFSIKAKYPACIAALPYITK